MSASLRTIEGDSFEAGFWGSDTTQIMLGELPNMSIEQFSQFSGEAIAQCIPLLSPVERQEAAGYLEDTMHKLEGVPARTLASPYNAAEDVKGLYRDFMDKNNSEAETALAGEGLAKAIGSSLGNVGVFYSSNPFIVREDTVVIGGQYEVEHLEFIFFTLNYLEGGGLGWHEQLGVPGGVIDAVQQIGVAFEQVSSS